MRSSHLSLLALALIACGDDTGQPIDAPLAIDAAVDAQPDGPTVWGPPSCTTVTGTGAVTFTHDEGTTVAARDQALTGVKYTFGLVALKNVPNALLASHANRVLRSDDAGCSWRDIGDARGLAILVAAGDRAYGYADNNPQMIRIMGDTVTALRDHSTGVVGMGVDPADPLHVRIVDSDAQLWDSTDGGDNFTAIGRRADVGQITYRGAFSPTDLDHVIVGVSTTGAHVSRNGGTNWTPATGLSTGSANAMNIAFSPSDPQVVWVTGVDLANNCTNCPKLVWRSIDGGTSFTAAFDNSTGLTIVSGMPLFPHPTDTTLLYATFGTYFQDYGTDIYRYSSTTDEVTVTHQPFHDVLAIAFLPTDPSWMYLGITHEQIGGL